MISSNELDYVAGWPSKVPYPGKKYAKEALEELKKSIEIFDSQYKNVRYNVCFSDSKELKLEILDKNVAHMLGVDYKNLTGTYHEPFRKEVLGMSENESISSYDLLNELSKKIDQILDYELDTKIRVINYYAMRIKCAIFEKIADLSKFNYGCIDFDKEEYSKNSERPFLGNSKKILFTESGEVVCPYFMMGFVKTSNPCVPDEELYVVETLIAPSKPAAFFQNQHTVIPTHLLYDKNGNFIKDEATPESKIQLLKMYKEIMNVYNIDNQLDIQGDYVLMLQNQIHGQI